MDRFEMLKMVMTELRVEGRYKYVTVVLHNPRVFGDDLCIQHVRGEDTYSLGRNLAECIHLPQKVLDDYVTNELSTITFKLYDDNGPIFFIKQPVVDERMLGLIEDTVDDSIDEWR